MTTPIRTSQWKHSNAELCRQQGWGAGTVLVSPALPKHVDQSPWRVRITAIGISEVMVVQLYADERNRDIADEEVQWDLTCRDWQVESLVPEPSKEAVLRAWLHGEFRTALHDEHRILEACADLKVGVDQQQPSERVLAIAIAGFVGRLIESDCFPRPAEEES